MFKHADKLPGGEADGMADASFDKEELSKGVDEEQEHTNDPAIAKEIAKDHLKEEGPKYYSHLEILDKKLDKKAFLIKALVKASSVDIRQPYSQPAFDLDFPEMLSRSTLTKNEASLLANAMQSRYPRALQNTRVELNGASPRDWSQRVHQNPGLTNADIRQWGHTADTKFETRTRDIPDAYLHSPNTTVIRSGNPGIMVHELGHAIDFNDFPQDSFIRRRLARMYRNYAPTLWKEHAAWRKGTRGFTEGAAKNKLDPELVLRTLRDIKASKPSGLGSYWGAGIGGMGGLALGALGAVGVASSTGKLPLAFPAAGLILGGSLGAGLGMRVGNALTSEKRLNSEAMREKFIHTYAKSYSKMNNIPYAKAVEEIQDKLNKKKQQQVA